jgi:hypothetical protein
MDVDRGEVLAVHSPASGTGVDEISGDEFKPREPPPSNPATS